VIKYNSEGVEIFDFKPPATRKEIILLKKLSITAEGVRFRPERVGKRRDEL